LRGSTGLRSALYYNTTGYYNSGVGGLALYNNTSGYENTAIGDGALSGNTTGYANIGVGYRAGWLTTGNNNIYIGHPGISGDNNVTRIGNGQNSTYLSGAVYGTSFNATSDRNAKENFAAIDPEEILAKVVSISVKKWNYRTDKGAEHIGPTAQEFHDAFGLNGMDDKHISLLDESGVALAAIQALNRELREKDAQIVALTARMEQLERHNNIK
jgi:hypothetical protein